MAKQDQVKAQPDKGQHSVGSAVVAELPSDAFSLAERPAGTTAAAGGGSVEAQAAWLGDRRLHGAQRRAMALQIARTQGNRHLQRLVSSLNGGRRIATHSSTGRVVQRQGGGASGGGAAAAGVLSDFQVQQSRADDVLKASYGSLIRAKKKVSYTLQEVDDATIKEKFVSFHIRKGHTHPRARPRRPWKPEDANDIRTLKGFADSDARIIYINSQSEKDEQVVTMVHEMLHMNAASGFASTVGPDIDEGVTEHLTIQACSRKGISFEPDYRSQVYLAEDLAAIVGMGLLTQAYFNGAHIMRTPLNTLQGPLTYETLIKLLKSGRMTEAFDLLKLRGSGSWIRAKIKMIKGYLSGWVSDADIEAIRIICSTLTGAERRTVRDAIAPLVTELWSHGQRAELRIILGVGL